MIGGVDDSTTSPGGPSRDGAAVRLASRFTTKREFAAHMLRQWILDGRYAPGQRLREEQVAVELKVSPTPVREALLLLEAEGLIATASHRGAVVVRLDREAVAEVYRIREVLEVLATQLAMQRSSAAERRRLLADLRSVHARMTDALDADRTEFVPRLNREFHWLIYTASASPRLLETIDRLWNILPHRWLRQIPGRARWALDQHAGIIAALAADDPDRVAGRMGDHVRIAAESLVAYLDRAEDTLAPEAAS